MLFSKQTSNHIFTKPKSALLFAGNRMDKVCSDVRYIVRQGFDCQVDRLFSSFRDKNSMRVKEIKSVFV